MNKKVDAESTLALMKHRLRKEKLHEDDKRCAKRDIAELKARIKALEKDIADLMKSTRERISDIESGHAWYAGMVVAIVITIIVLAVAYTVISPLL
jgi:flagellar motility protein MotE (MotC chaperone)